MNIIRYVIDKYFRDHKHIPQPKSKKDWKYEDHFEISGSSQVDEDVIVDNRPDNPRIYNQYRDQKCTGMVVGTMIEKWLLKYDAKIRLSKKYNWDKARARHGYPKENKGVYARYTWDSVIKDGMVKESIWPTSQSFRLQPTEAVDKIAKVFSDLLLNRSDKIAHYYPRLSSVDKILEDGYDVAFSVRTNNSFYGNSTGFIKDEPSSQGFHYMFIEGYFYKDSIKYYICRNSWGRSFGDKGYAYIPATYMKRYGRDYAVCRERVKKK